MPRYETGNGVYGKNDIGHVAIGNGALGGSDIEGKAAMGSGERGSIAGRRRRS